MRDVTNFASAYYSMENGPLRGDGDLCDSPIEHEIRQALFRRDAKLRERVERVCKNSHTLIREYLRSETGLKLSQAEKHQAVPIKVIDGIPTSFQYVVEKYPPLIWYLYQNKNLLEATQSGIALVRQNLKEILELLKYAPEHDASFINSSQDLLSKLIAKVNLEEPKKLITEINEDILGSYYFKVPLITIHWMVIGIVSEMLNVDVEDLTLVVLTHELAHAYTHRGADIDGIQWETATFARADLPIVEGLAQFYTESICKKYENKRAGVLEAFERLLKLQSEVYTLYRTWVNDHHAEVIRFCMIWARTNSIQEHTHFLDEIKSVEDRIKVGFFR